MGNPALLPRGFFAAPFPEYPENTQRPQNKQTAAYDVYRYSDKKPACKHGKQYPAYPLAVFPDFEKPLMVPPTTKGYRKRSSPHVYEPVRNATFRQHHFALYSIVVFWFIAGHPSCR
jgi:hypothetical protein